MSTIKLEVGKVYKTRGGLKAYVNGKTCSSDYPFYGHIENKGGPEMWEEDGRYTCSESLYDLVSEWTEPKKVKVYLYKDESGTLWATDLKHSEGTDMAPVGSAWVIEGEFVE